MSFLLTPTQDSRCGCQRNRSAHLHGRGVVPSDICSRAQKSGPVGTRKSASGRQVRTEMLRTLFHPLPAWDLGMLQICLRSRSRFVVNTENSRKKDEDVVYPSFHGEEVSCEQWKLIFCTG